MVKCIYLCKQNAIPIQREKKTENENIYFLLFSYLSCYKMDRFNNYFLFRKFKLNSLVSLKSELSKSIQKQDLCFFFSNFIKLNYVRKIEIKKKNDLNFRFKLIRYFFFSTSLN